MLVLTRKDGQQIRIGDEVTITILRIQGRSVRVGIEAPREISVVRAELTTPGAPVRPAESNGPQSGKRDDAVTVSDEPSPRATSRQTVKPIGDNGGRGRFDVRGQLKGQSSAYRVTSVRLPQRLRAGGLRWLAPR